MVSACSDEDRCAPSRIIQLVAPVRNYFGNALGTFDVKNVLKERTHVQPEETRCRGRPKEPGRLRMPLILELLRGADLESTSRKHRVTAAPLTEWRDRLLAGGQASLKSREVNVEDKRNDD